MKKITAIVLSILTVLSLGTVTGCSNNPEADSGNSVNPYATDYEYIRDKGRLVIGITLFAPMNYMDTNGKLTGFEVDFAQMVCQELGVTPEFQEINWKSKETELNSKNIDCLWNGMTITPERQETMSITNAYMANKQVICVKTENAAKYTTAESLNGKRVVAESESAGEGVAKNDKFFTKATYTAVDSQAKALMEVSSGTADACVIDYVASIGMIGEGTDYSGLVMIDSVAFADEEYGIAFRKDSDMTVKINAIIEKLIYDGTVQKIAEKYKLEKQIIVK